MRELLPMCEGKQRHQWAIGCEIVAAIVNQNRDKHNQLKGSDLNPFNKPEKPSPEKIAAEIQQAKALVKAQFGNKL